MIPLKLSVSNFMSYKEMGELDFRKISTACISGANGVGKSSVLEAIAWVLWGKTRSFSDDNLIYQGSQNMWIELEFEIGKISYKVARKRTLKGRGSTELNLFKIEKNGLKNLTEDSITNTQKKIVEILKMPYEIFVNSAYLRQGQADEFTKKTPAKRKEILSEILGLNYYENLHLFTKEKIRKREAEAEVLAMQVEELADEIEDKDEIKKELKKVKGIFIQKKKVLDKKLTEFKQKQKIKKDYDEKSFQFYSIKEKYLDKINEAKAIVEENKEINQEILELKKIESQTRKIEEKFCQYKNTKDQLEKYHQNFENLTSLNQKKQNILYKIEQEKHRVEIINREIFTKNQTKIEALNQRINLLKKSKICPTCNQNISTTFSQKLIKKLEKEIKKIKLKKKTIIPAIEKMAKEIKLLDKKIATISYSKKEHRDLKNKLQELEIFEEQREKLFSAKATLKEKEKMAAVNRQKIFGLKKELQKLKQNGQKINLELKKVAPQIKDLDLVEEEIENQREELFDFQEKFTEIKSRYQEVMTNEKNLKDKKIQLKKTQKEASLLEELFMAFSKKGIQSMIIESALPEIQDTANEILRKMTNGKLKVLFETKRQKKTDKKITETLEIKIIDILGARPYEMFSGGEAFRIDFAVRIALSELLTKRAGAKLQFLAIDEGFGSQDAEGRANLVEAIKSIEKDFKKILVITHIQELKDMFPQRVEVIKDENGSHIRVYD